MSNLTVYTCIIGTYDNLKPQPPGNYLAYTYPEQHLDPWITKVVDPRSINPTRDARQRKILSHQYVDTEWSLWIDGSFTLMVSPEEILRRYGQNDVTMFASRNYNTLKEESETIIKMNKDSSEQITNQYNHYVHQGYPDLRLTTTGAILRRHTPKVIEFNNYWWSELSAKSHRDQMSVDYAAWKTGVEIACFKDNIYESREFTCSPHNQ